MTPERNVKLFIEFIFSDTRIWDMIRLSGTAASASMITELNKAWVESAVARRPQPEHGALLRTTCAFMVSVTKKTDKINSYFLK